MAVTESQRQRLFRKVEEVFGPEEAATFMEVVLPGSWNDVATKRDLDELARRLEERFDHRIELVEGRFDHRFELVEGRFDHRFELIEHRLDTIEQYMATQLVDKAMLHRELRLQFAAILTANAAMAGLALAIAQAV